MRLSWIFVKTAGKRAIKNSGFIIWTIETVKNLSFHHKLNLKVNSLVQSSHFQNLKLSTIQFSFLFYSFTTSTSLEQMLQLKVLFVMWPERCHDEDDNNVAGSTYSTHSLLRHCKEKKNIFFSLCMSTRLLHWNCSRMEWNEMNLEFGVKNENFLFSWFNLLQVLKSIHRKMKFTIIIRIFLLNSKCIYIYEMMKGEEMRCAWKFYVLHKLRDSIAASSRDIVT